MFKSVSKVMAGVIVALLMGCGADGDEEEILGASSLVNDMCTRLDSCNILDGSVDDCVQESNKDIEDLTPNEVSDLNTEMRECLAFKTCDAFERCAFRSEDLATGSWTAR